MKYDLVFEGGGAKGMVFVGACAELFDRGHGYGRLLGTSAGAITATMLAAGYTPDELLVVLAEKGSDGKSVFAAFMGAPARFTDTELKASATRRLLDAVDVSFVPNFAEKKLHEKLVKALEASDRFRHVLSLVERGGWFAADRFVSWLGTKLDSGSSKGTPRRYSRMTLAQFFEATGVELSVVASDTSEGSLLVLNHMTAPDCPLVWAVRMSMSIPLVWDEVIWRAEWGQYLGRDITDHAIVDGGMLSNFPIELYISDAPQVLKLMGPKRSNEVLGLLIDEKLPVARDRLVTISIKPGELATVQRFGRLIDTATGAHDKMVIDEYSHLVVRLPAQGYGTTEFDMSDERRTALVRAGREAVARYFDSQAAPASRGLAVRGRAASRKTTTARGKVKAARVTATRGAAKRGKTSRGVRGQIPTAADRIARGILG
jgi:predicted acylesterase/phospholipase RssA